jgi:hypothetical protein
MTFDDNTLYKVLDGGKSCHGGSGTWTPGKWRRVRGEVIACVRGIHYCRGAQVLPWLGPELWLFEDGSDDHDDWAGKCVTRRGRVTERIETWNERTARLFAVDRARIVVNRHAQEDQKELLHACLNMTASAVDDAAAEYVARSVAWSVAGSAAEYVARSEQYALLCRYLSGEEGPFVEKGER